MLVNEERKQSNSEANIDEDLSIGIKAFKYRWFILFLYAFQAVAVAGVIFCMYNITDIMRKYYNISTSTLLIPASISNGVSIIFMIPSGFSPSRKGLRSIMVLSSGSLALSGSLLVPAVQRSGFYFFLASMIFSGITYGISNSLMLEISSVWFPTNELALATGISTQTIPLGIGLTCIQSMLLFDNASSMDKETLNYHLQLYIYIQSGLCILLFLLVLLFFEDKPKLPPTLSEKHRQQLNQTKTTNSIADFLSLMKNFQYMLCIVMFTLNLVVAIVFPLVLNSLVSPNYKNADKKVGYVGLIIVIACCTGGVIFSFVLTKIRYCKYQLFIQLFFSFGFSCFFAISIIRVYSFYIVCIAAVLFWFTYSSTLNIIIEIVAEITYPVNNSLTLVICFFSGNLIGIAVTQICGWLTDHQKNTVICWILAGSIGIQIILWFFLKIDYKRSKIDFHHQGQYIVEDTKYVF